MKKLIFVLSCLLLAIAAQARTITVDDDGPADFDNIQAAINDANDGDVVEVQPGTYTGPGNRDIDFLGKAITVRSTDPNDSSVVSETVIYCQGAGRGFTFYSGEGHNSVVAGLTIANGYANRGGGVYCLESSPTISYCTIIYNSSDWGGGISCTTSDAIITHCIITNNTAEWGGGGIICAAAGHPKIKHCTIAYNWTGIGNEWSPVGGGGINMNQCSLVVTNCILWGNTTESGKGPQIAVWGPGIHRLGISYCNVQGGREDVFGSALNWDIGNIDVAPLFANSASRDYHLKSQAGRFHPIIQTWIQDTMTSPCIDAGNPGCLLGDEPNDANNVRINMGAYGGTAQASKSPANWRSIADLTNDLTADFNDLGVFVDYWLEMGLCIPSDLNRNLFTDFNDYAIFANNWLWE